ncbi:MAG TPA: C10 family peptidase [Bacteroidales bacterium]|mgnify:CR=1 FL=1|nr:C10 family peptidase [Bacteroidales bacterium]HRX96004.1 C10 family peptidase [Bacteroidales bacterium]
MIKIYKIVLSIFLMVIQVTYLRAQFIEKQSAEAVALQFYNGQAFHHNHKLIASGVSNTRIFLVDQEPVIYQVNMVAGGFVLLSADERAWPVLGYDFMGMDFSEIPPALQDWIDGWSEQIQEIRNRNLSQSPEIQAFWENLKSGNFHTISQKSNYVAPLLYSEWGQHTYYNAWCPVDPDGPGGHALAGCVGIAISQVIFYYRYPETGNGSHGYNSDYGYEFADFGNTTYHWNNMVNSIYGMANPDIAELIYHVGVSVEMDYGSSGSGANTQDGVDALVDYFRYSPDASYLPRFDVPDTFKDSLILNLDQNRPCIFRGGGLSSSHSFVCDGYHDSLYFHFNWGWNGDFDGFFHINNLNPWVYDFTFNQGAIINIFPNENYPDYCQGEDTLNAKRGTFNDGSGTENYQDNSYCSWLIGDENTEGEQVMLWFPYFELDDGNDFVYVYDGESEAAPLIGQLSGNDPDVDFLSSGKTLFVVFESDNNGSAPGFLGEWVTINGPWCNNQITMTNLSKTWFSDASGPYPYTNNSDCNWIIEPQEEGYDSIAGIFVFFHSFSLADGDTLFFYDARNSEEELITALTKESEPDTVFTNTNILKLNFKTDDHLTGSGWGAGYGSLFPVYCSDTLYFTDKTGVVNDGSGEKNYTNNSNCFFDIYNQDALAITLTFTEFEMEWGYDRLQIYDLHDVSPVLLKTLWGDVLPDPLTFETNHLLLNFVTDVSSVFKGWTCEYDALAPGINDPTQKYVLHIFPNPASEHILISLETLNSDPIEIEIFDLFSRSMYSEIVIFSEGKLEKAISVDHWQPGAYLLQIKMEDAVLWRKFLKQ